MLPKVKTIFISLIILFLIVIGGGFLLGISSGSSEIKKEFILRKELKKSPLGTIDPKNPYYSQPLGEKEIPQGAIQLKVSQKEGFQPAQFKVKTGQLVILTLSNTDNNFHSLFFEDKGLKKISIMTESGITRGIVFFAPEKRGEYKFFDNETQDKERKEGLMIVR